MREAIRGVLVMVGMGGLAACASAPSRAPQRGVIPAHVVIEAYAAAFNRHDPEAMREWLAEDVIWFQLENDGLTEVARGRDEIVGMAVQAFGDLDDLRMEVIPGAKVHEFVHAVEMDSWGAGADRVTATQLVTYQILGGRIARIWFFPSSVLPPELPRS
ncbi:MAG: nuclear transport factor 2 family protein [Gemmatimonadota bacterium]